MTADVEDEFIVAQANEPLDRDGRLSVNQRVSSRRRDEILEVDRERVDYMDVSPKMVVSVATAMIPFLENDDANRALMGSNMQRQAVPLLVTEAPIVGTGMEHKAACDSGVCILARSDGIVDRVTAETITVAHDNGETKEYELIEVHALEPGHLHQPAPDRRRRRASAGACEGPGPGRRPRHEQGEIAWARTPRSAS